MKKLIEIIKRLFMKKQIYVMDVEDLKEFMSQKNIVCRSCHKPITNYKEISKIYIKDKQVIIYCISCRG